MVTPHRGDIFWVNLDPTIGSEIRKKRPALIVSNDAANRRYHQITVVLLTSQRPEQAEDFQVYLTKEESGLSKDSKALAEQIRTISKLRLGPRIGHIGEESLRAVEKALKVHLDLD